MRRGAESGRLGDRLNRFLAGPAGSDGLRDLLAADAGPARDADADPHGPRWNPGRRGVLAMAVVAVLSTVVAGCWVLAARPRSVTEPGASSVSSVSSATVESSQSIAPGGSLASPLPGTSGPPAGLAPDASAAPTSDANAVVVDVVGKVRKPGVYRLRAGARVNDAVAAAGGAAAGVDLSRVNLARKLADGEQVAIGVPAAPDAAAGQPAAGGAGAAGPGPLDLNAATESQLESLPGVGPVLAQRIVDYRNTHGPFTSVQQLNSVSGIGDAKFGDLQPLVTVS